ncbi:Vms1/Ankzf1 family peptidyl-tRNA hydrolase [Natronorarus salvus]|uniref:Vms1/Ankzf1 family peptidyl-tRNA hydrolase n=1 Tax=Natronorarus salvus TaxID=3117733 RepID=UPI002F267BD2
MLDELLGRAELRTRIEELEEERERLAGQLEGERERRREAVRDRQDADKRVNRLEDRIAQLDDRVERLSGDEAEIGFRGVETLSGGRLDAVLDRVESVEAQPDGALTAMVDEGTEIPAELWELLGDRSSLVSRAAPCLVLADDAGLVAVALRPPIEPEPMHTWSGSFEIDRAWFQPIGRFAFALVRSDLFAMAEYDGRERLSFSKVESEVKGEHSKGGFSQGRFERRRDAQIDAHLDRSRDRLADRETDRLILVGQRTLLGEFEADVSAPSDASGDPEEALDRAFFEFFTTRLYRL